MTSDILIVDDEADIRELVSGILSDEGHGTRMAADADAALAEVSKRRPSLIFLDIWLQGSRIDGLALLDAIGLAVTVACDALHVEARDDALATAVCVDRREVAEYTSPDSDALGTHPQRLAHFQRAVRVNRDVTVP